MSRIILLSEEAPRPNIAGNDDMTIILTNESYKLLLNVEIEKFRQLLWFCGGEIDVNSENGRSLFNFFIQCEEKKLDFFMIENDSNNLYRRMFPFRLISLDFYCQIIPLTLWQGKFLYSKGKELKEIKSCVLFSASELPYNSLQLVKTFASISIPQVMQLGHGTLYIDLKILPECVNGKSLLFRSEGEVFLIASPEKDGIYSCIFITPKLAFRFMKKTAAANLDYSKEWKYLKTIEHQSRKQWKKANQRRSLKRYSSDAISSRLSQQPDQCVESLSCSQVIETDKDDQILSKNKLVLKKLILLSLKQVGITKGSADFLQVWNTLYSACQYNLVQM